MTYSFTKTTIGLMQQATVFSLRRNNGSAKAHPLSEKRRIYEAVNNIRIQELDRTAKT